MLAGPSTSRKQVNRFFQIEWLNTFVWLRWETEKKIAHCEVCRAAKNTSKFATGISFDGGTPPNFRASSLKAHEGTGVHAEAIVKSVEYTVEDTDG